MTDTTVDPSAAGPRTLNEVDPGWDDAIEVGPGVALLHYPNNDVALWHACHDGDDTTMVLQAPVVATKVRFPAAPRVDPETGEVDDPAPLRLGLLRCDACGLAGRVDDRTWVADAGVPQAVTEYVTQGIQT